MEDTTQSEPATKADLTGGLTKLKTELTETITHLAIELSKTQADVREIKYDIATKLSTKDDINRILNAVDKFAGMADNYRRKDMERGHMLMEQHDKLEDHENRITLLESPR